MNKCAGGNRSVGGVMGGMRRGRTIACPVCGKRVGVRPGRAGYTYPHKSAQRSPEAEAERAVRLLMDEVIASGNGQARDFGWKPAIEAGRAVLRNADNGRESP